MIMPDFLTLDRFFTNAFDRNPYYLYHFPKEEAARGTLRYVVNETTPEKFVKKVIFNAPATIVFWYDGTKTVVKCGPNDAYDPEKGFAIAFMKRFFGNGLEFHKCLKSAYPEIDKWWERNMDSDCAACQINID